MHTDSPPLELATVLARLSDFALRRRSARFRRPAPVASIRPYDPAAIPPGRSWAGTSVSDLPGTYAERYAGHWRLTAAEFESHLFRRALFPHARLIWRLLNRIRPNYFWPDRGLIAALALVRTRRALAGEILEFHRDERNRRPARRWLRLRISATRLKRLLRECDSPEAAGGGPGE
ncbi:MAG: hypothetical protein ACHQ5A_15045 [Opitutales bacterium]